MATYTELNRRVGESESEERRSPRWSPLQRGECASLFENPKEKESDKEGQDKMGRGLVSLHMCPSVIGCQ